MPDIWDQFPDAPQQPDPWAAFPDATPEIPPPAPPAAPPVPDGFDVFPDAAASASAPAASPEIKSDFARGLAMGLQAVPSMMKSTATATGYATGVKPGGDLPVQPAAPPPDGTIPPRFGGFGAAMKQGRGFLGKIRNIIDQAQETAGSTIGPFLPSIGLGIAGGIAGGAAGGPVGSAIGSGIGAYAGSTSQIPGEFYQQMEQAAAEYNAKNPDKPIAYDEISKQSLKYGSLAALLDAIPPGKAVHAAGKEMSAEAIRLGARRAFEKFLKDTGRTAMTEASTEGMQEAIKTGAVRESVPGSISGKAAGQQILEAQAAGAIGGTSLHTGMTAGTKAVKTVQALVPPRKPDQAVTPVTPPAQQTAAEPPVPPAPAQQEPPPAQQPEPVPQQPQKEPAPEPPAPPVDDMVLNEKKNAYMLYRSLGDSDETAAARILDNQERTNNSGTNMVLWSDGKNSGLVPETANSPFKGGRKIATFFPDNKPATAPVKKPIDSRETSPEPAPEPEPLAAPAEPAPEPTPTAAPDDPAEADLPEGFHTIDMVDRSSPASLYEPQTDIARRSGTEASKAVYANAKYITDGKVMLQRAGNEDTLPSGRKIAQPPAETVAQLKTVLEAVPEKNPPAFTFEPVAGYDAALLGQKPGEVPSNYKTVYGLLGDQVIAIPPRAYDVLVRQKGYDIRGTDEKSPLGIYDGDKLVGAIVPVRHPERGLGQAPDAIKALRGRVTPEQARATEPGKPMTRSVRPTVKPPSLTAPQRAAANQKKDEFIARLKEARARVEKDGDKAGVQEITLETAAGGKTTYLIPADVAQIDALIKEFGKKGAQSYAYDRAAEREESAAPAPATPERSSDPFYQRLISLRRSIWSAAGIDPRVGENMPPGKQMETFKKVFDETFDLGVEALKTADFASALNNLKDYYVEIMAMASIMRMPARAIGLRMGDSKANRLTVAFTRDGKQGWAGLFMPDKKTIVIPGRARSFGHEFFHALDFRLLDIMGRTADELGRHFRGYTARVRREGLDYEPGSVQEAMVNLMDAMFFDDAFAASRIMALEQEKERARTDRTKAEIDKKIENVKRGKDRAFKFRSEYYRRAAAMDKAGEAAEDKGYWAMPTEMFARAGEAYIAHRAEAAMVDIRSITKDADVYEGAAADLAARYPQEGDRFRIFSAFDRLLDAAAREGILSGTVPADEAFFPNDNEYADPVRWFRAQAGYEKPKRSLIEKIIGTPQERAELRRTSRHILGFDKNRPFNGVTVGRYMRDVQMAYGTAISRHMKVLAARYDSPTLDRMVEKISRKGNRYDAIHAEFYNKYSARMGRILERSGLRRLDDKQMDVLNDLLLGYRQDVPAGYDSEKMLDAAAGIREMLDEMVGVLREDYGVDVGYIKDMDAHYMPSVPDRAWTSMNRDKAIEEYAEAYAIKFEEDMAAIEAGTLAPEDARFDPDTVDIAEEARAAAEVLVDEINLGEALNHGITGAPGGFTKRRTFSGRAQRALKNARIKNPVDLLEFYISAASRKAAWTKVFDPTEGAYIADIKRLQDEGVSVLDTKIVDHLVRSATRRERSGNVLFHNGVAALEGLKILLSMAMLARVQVLALFEPVVTGLRTRNVIDSFRGFYDAANENIMRADAEERRMIMEAFGIIPNEHASMILLDREGGTFGNTPKLTRAASEVFMATLTTKITEATRRGNVASAERYFYFMAADAKQGKKKSRRDAAREELVYSGVPAGRVDEMVDYILGLDMTLPPLEDVGKKFDHPARIYARMLQEFTSDATQKPEPSDRSWAMNTAIGGILFAYPGFQIRIYEQIFKRNRDVMWQAYKRGGVVDGAKVLAGGILAPWTAYYAAQCAAYLLKTLLFNRQSWDEKDDEEKIKLILSGGFAYSIPLGFYGDLAYQFWSGTRYAADIGRMFSGKLGYLFDAADRALRIIPNNYRRNSPDNNKQERAAAEGLYRGFALPAMGYGLAALPAPPLIKGAAGLGYAWLGSPDATKAMSMAVVGETEKEKQKRLKDERKKEREKK